MQNKIRRLLSCLIIMLSVLLSSFFMGFDSKASDTYYVDYNQPVCSENSGYLNLIMRDRVTGDDVLMTFYWSVSPYSQIHNSDVSSISSTHMTLYIDNRGIVEFWPKSAGSVYASVSIMFYSGNGFYEQAWVNDTISFGEVTKQYILNWSELYTFEGYQVFGNYGNVNANFMSPFFTVVYGDTKIEIEEQEKSNSWLQKIWTSIQGLFKGDNVEDDAKVEEFGDTTTQQSDKISDLQEQNKVEKVDTDSASSSVDSNIDAEEIGNFGTVLTVFTGDTHILQYILIVLSVALISYVLFGKR